MKKALAILLVSSFVALLLNCIPPDRPDIDQGGDATPSPTPSSSMFP